MSVMLTYPEIVELIDALDTSIVQEYLRNDERSARTIERLRAARAKLEAVQGALHGGRAESEQLIATLTVGRGPDATQS
ncbi:MAG: hypothetical protein NVSMB65_03260 [Chloroflexota bacterium]